MDQIAKWLITFFVLQWWSIQSPIGLRKSFEIWIMELFEKCLVCKWACDVKTQRIGTFLSVEQLCTYCQYSRHWNSQPVLGITRAGNLQPSFFKLEKVNEEHFVIAYGWCYWIFCSLFKSNYWKFYYINFPFHFK